MPLDRISEEIAHFIGLFHLDTEAARMRDGYEAFRTVRDAEVPPDDLPRVTIKLNAPYDVKPFEPGLKFHPLLSVQETAVPVGAMPFGPAHQDITITITGQTDLPQVDDGVTFGAEAAHVRWLIPLPNSILSVTAQFLWLSDNDVLDFGFDAPFLSPSFYAAKFAALIGTAESLALGLSEQITPGHMPEAETILAVIASAGGHVEAAPAGVEVSVVQGADATGIVINGVVADEMPDFRENLPQALREEDEAEEEDVAGGPSDEDEADSPFAVDPGHHVETGGNLAANEAYVGSNWVDAKVIAVMGDVVQLDVISQVNILSDGDIGTHPGAPSWAVNAARIEMQSSEAGDLPAPAAGVFPSHWQVVRVEGDVVAVNWIQQHVFATDYDRVEVQFSGSNTFLGLGGNLLGNLASLVELGFHYDLIIVGGRMISMNMVEQINVLLDDDWVSGAVWVPDAISGGDNYLQNSATISTTGIDTITAMTEAFRAAGEALAAGGSSISAALAADPLFAGKATLSVLYISGDLIEVNAIEQLNYVGDSDQVYLALHDFVAGAGEDVTVTTGSNALLNDATITDIGIDSTVLAGGQVYSDALIHQAGLIDTDAAPDGVVLSGLTNEAIAAFLASDMIDPPANPEDYGGVPPAMAEGGGLDVMQSVLA